MAQGRSKLRRVPRTGYDDVHLVTGFPSFVARRVVLDLLEEERRPLIFVVVLARFVPVAAEVLDALPRDKRERVVLLEGDAAAIDLGLGGGEYLEIARSIDWIHHLAHASYAGGDPRQAEAVNVGGAAEIVELARNAPSLRCLVFHSTTNVAGARTGVVYENELEAGQSFRNAIEETRMRAERLVRRAMAEHPIAIVRPAPVVGDSGSGKTRRFDGPNLLFLLIVAAPADLRIPVLGRGDAPLHFVPVDFVSRASRAIARHPDGPGGIFHLVDPDPPSAARVFELVARAAGKRAPSGSIPEALARVLLRAPGLERIAADPRTLTEQLVQKVSFDATRARAILSPQGITCPPFASYVDHVVGALEEHLGRGRTTEVVALETPPTEAPPPWTPRALS